VFRIKGILSIKCLTYNRYTPKEVPLDLPVSFIFAASSSSFAICLGGQLYGWGGATHACISSGQTATVLAGVECGEGKVTVPTAMMTGMPLARFCRSLAWYEGTKC
jgi:hypothetical protein